MKASFRVSVCITALTIGCGLATQTFAQPRTPPPKRYSAEEAAKMLGGSTSITLTMQGAKPAEVLESVAKQARMSVQDDLTVELQNHAPINVSYEKQPLWSVLRALSADLKTNLGIAADSSFGDSESGSSLVQSGYSIDGPAFASGPVMIVIHNIARSIELTAAGKPAGEQRLNIELLALFDPKFKLRDGYPRGGKLELQAADGTALKPLGPEWNWVQEPKKLSPLVWSMKASAALPDPSLRRLGKVQGELSGFVSTLSTEKWEIDNPLKSEPSQKSIADAEFAFRRLIKAGASTYTLQIASYGQGEETDFGWPPRTNDDRVRSLQLLDDRGQHFAAHSWKFEGGKGEVEFRARPTDGNAAKLVWELPAQVGEIRVPFEFNDLPLP